MANKILDWSLFGSYGTGVHSGMSVDTGGIAVSVDFNAQDHGATATTDSETQYSAAGENFDSSSLRLYGQGGEGGQDDTSTTTLNFSSTDALYQDEVSNVSFRINDLDVGTYHDNHQDIVSIRAYDADGNEVPVTLSTTGGATIVGNTAYAQDVDNGSIQADDATGSILVEIQGPVAKIEIDYDNGDCTDQAVWVTDVHFDTISADLRDGYVEGNDSDNLIDVAYTGDPDGDMIDAGDAILPGEAAQDDIVLAYDGNDTVLSGAGDDDVYAGGGDDYVEGGAGNDILLGDQNIEGHATGGTAPTGEYVRESFEWDQAGVAAGHDLGGFTQDTGNVNVTFSVVSTHESPCTTFADNQQKVHSVDTGTETIDAFSSLSSELNSNDESATYAWDFSDPVQDVAFRINDIDHDSRVTIRAYDADGNLINVDGAQGSYLSETEVNHVYTVFPKYDNIDRADTSPEVSDLITIAGPVARIEITHEQDGYDSSGINITDMYFDAPVMAEVPADCDAGDDTLHGGEGDDLIAGQGGADSLTGGEGADTIYGGSVDAGTTTANLIVNGSFEDTSGMVATGYGFVGAGAIPGWTEKDGEEIDVHNDDRGGVQPTDGDNWLDLAGTPGNSIVGQDVQGVIDGEEYTLTFDAGDIADSRDGTSGDNQIDVIWNGQVIDTIDPVDGAMSSYSYTLTGGAGDGSNRLEFAGRGYVDNYGASVDNVQLVGPTAVEECGEDEGDTIIGGAGEDVLYGQAGDDLFVAGSVAEAAGDVVVGGNGPDQNTDNDVLDLRGTGQVVIDDAADATDAGATAGTVTFADGSVLTFSQIETILTDPQNQAPTAVDDAVTVNEDGSTTFNPAANDIDPDGDTLTVTEVTQPSHGTVTLNGDGTVTYTPDPDYNGPDSFTYTITDPSGETSTATVDVTVAPQPDAPVAQDDVAETDEDTSVSIDVLDNDSDPDGDDLVVKPGSPVADNGTVSINPDGTLEYTPNPDFNGTDTITYTVTDPDGNEDTATVTVTVNPAPDAPVAQDDVAETDEDTSVSIDVLDNDSDPDGDDLVVKPGSPVADNGSVSINPDGTLEYTPNPDFNGTDTITYTVTDPDGNEDTATVTVTVNPAPDAPVAQDDVAETDEDTSVSIDVLDNDSDPDGDDLVVKPGSPVADNGSVSINPDGTLEYTPNPDFNGTDTITYTVTDPDGNEDTATVTVTVNPAPDAPVAQDDVAETDEDTSVSIDVLDNDSDPDGDDLVVKPGSPVADNGTVSINPDGTLEYTPNPDFNGTDTITYTVTDPDGNEDTATVTVTVNPVNDPPVAQDDSGTTPFNTAVTIDVLGNDSDVDGDTLSITALTSPNGTVADNGDGTITFTPTDGFEGDAVINYTISDGNGGFDDAVVTVTVTADPRDGIVEGTSGDDVIDVAYDGDPNGDFVDNDDALLPGETGDDDIIRAYEGDDRVDAGDGDDEIDAGEGDDTVYGREGDDVVEAGDGNDSVRGNEGNDTLLGGEGMDTLRGGEDDDTVDGGIGDDLLYGGTGDDSVTGGEGNDEIFGNEGNDTIDGGDGDDLINSRSADAINDYETFVGVPFEGDPDNANDLDLVYGGAGNDTILTGDDADTVYGGTGADSIDSGIDADEVYGGEGDDYIDANLGSDYVDGGDGDDTIIAGIDAFSDYVGDDPNLPSGFLIDPATGLPALSDPNTEDGKDTVIGGQGNDYIVTGDDADSIEGGADNDTIDAGIDDDYVDGGTGDDSIIGGHGSDTIYGQDGNDWINAGDSSLLWGQEPDDTDPVPENGRDFVDGGAGNDTIFGEDDDDTLLGGTGDDYIDGGIDEDSIEGGEGADTLLGGDGKDTILGGLGDDSIDGGRNADVLDGGEGNDTLIGENGEDTLIGGAGNDLLDGGTGGDVMDGGTGDDTIIGSSGRDTIDGGTGNDEIDSGLGEDIVHGGAGDDTITAGPEDDTIYGDEGADLIFGGNGTDLIDGGDDRDTIMGGTDGDVIDGGAGGDDFDTLDLRGSAPTGGSLNVTFTGPDSNGNGQDGFVTYYDASGAETGRFDFSEIEEVIPCFTPGTTIATPKGERLVEELQVGDRVITRDNGLQEIRWIGQKGLTGVQLQRHAHLKPVLIKRGALGNGLPERDMLVSPNHRVLVNNEKTALYFEEREVLAAAKHLIGAEGIHEVDVMGTTYIHFMFDHHEVVLSNGSWTESFQPGDYTLQGIGNAQRNEIFELFPELKTKEGVTDYQSARRALKKHEAKLLIK